MQEDGTMMKFKQESVFVPRIKVVGVGGGGCNAVNSMVRLGEMDSVDLIAVNTDLQHLEKCLAKDKIQIGKELSRGLGAGADPEMGRAAALESIEEVREAISNTDILFMLAGLGGGTGTGAMPVIAQAAKEQNILTIAVVSLPFQFEGKARNDRAQMGLENLRKTIDTIICIPNDRLFEIVGEGTSLLDAFSVTDNILCEGVRAISSLMSNTGHINVDFADMRTIMKEKGRAILSFGEGSGKGKAVNAIEAALTSPFIEWHDISGARAILINFTGGRDLTLFEINDALKSIKKISSHDANIIFGTVIDESLQDHAYVTLLVTGLANDMFGCMPAPAPSAVEPVIPESRTQEDEMPFVKQVEEQQDDRHSSQAVMDFPPQDRGIFEAISPTMYDGENLDIPAFMRKTPAMGSD